MGYELRQCAACLWICIFLLEDGEDGNASDPAADVGDLLQSICNRIFQFYDLRYHQTLGYVVYCDGYSVVYIWRCNYGDYDLPPQKKILLTLLVSISHRATNKIFGKSMLNLSYEFLKNLFVILFHGMSIFSFLQHIS